MLQPSPVPGELLLADGDIVINEGRDVVQMKVTNRGDRPIQVGSHYQFAETNCALDFDRAAAPFRLEWLTLAWMVIEALVAIASGVIAGSLMLTAFALDSVIELISAGVLIWRLRDELRRGEAFSRHTERIASFAAFDVHFDQQRRVAAKLDKRVDRDDVDADRAGRIKSSRRGVRAALN